MGSVNAGGGLFSGGSGTWGHGALGTGLGNGKALGGMFGTAGGAGGSGFDAPQAVGLEQAATGAQAQEAQGGVNNSLASQNALLAALNGQNGLGQQNSAMNTNQQFAGQAAGANGIGNQMSAMNQQQGFNQQLAGANGIGTQQSAIGGLQNVAAQQQGTANMYHGLATGTGPNPAQAALNQSTGQNVANQAALMAGQRGAGSNVGLLARQSAQQGANTQQQAVGQSATMQANQQIAGLQGLAAQQAAMGNTQQQIGGLGTTQAGMQQAGINAQGALGGQQTAQQMAANQAVNNQANVMAGQQIAGTGAATQAQLANAGQLQGAVANYNTANVSNNNSVNAGNTALATTNMQGNQAMMGGLLGGVGSIMGGARGGYVGMAEGGDPMQPYPAPNGQGPVMPAPVQAAPPGPAPVTAPPPPGPQSSFGQYLSGMMNTGDYLGAQKPIQGVEAPVDTHPTETPIQGPTQLGWGSQALYKGASSTGKGAGKMAGLAAMAAARGGKVEHDFRGGGHVKASTPAEKAVKPGNSYKNDKVKALLSEGEVVIPRDIMESPDPARSAADFVSKVLAKRKGA